MFLALRELAFARGRFALMGSVVALIGILMVLLSGLSVGLVNDGVSGLKKMPVTSFVFQEGVSKDAAFSRSLVEVSAAEEWSAVDGVADATPFGNALVNTTTDRDVDVDLALFGAETDSFVFPDPAEGEAPGRPGEVLVSETLRDDGVHLGDTLTVAPIGTELTVVGFLDGQHTFGHVDAAYLDLPTWQEVRAGVRPGEEAAPWVYEEVSTIAVRADDAGPDLTVADRDLGHTSMTLEESFGASPGYTAETSTLQLIQAFLYAISALVVGAFFTVVTIQRRQEIAVLRAMGASTSYLLRDSLTQSLLLLVGATGVGVGIGVAAGTAIATTPMPFGLEAVPIAVASTLLVLLGLLGAAVAVLRITRVDPLTALGGNR